MKLKSLKKKLQRLEAELKKDSKKLTKLQRKVEAALRAESSMLKPIPAAQNGAEQTASAPEKKKRNLTPEGRAKLAALMKARWDAKRAAVQSSIQPESA